MITVFLRKTNGKGQKLQVDPSSDIAQLMKELEQALASPQDDSDNNKEFEAYFRGTKLNGKEDQSLEDIGIQNNSIIHIVQQPKLQQKHDENLRVKLILQGRLFEYQISTSLNIQDLKNTICDDLDIEKDEDLTLSFLGVELDPTRTVASYRFDQDVLISASLAGNLNLINYRKTYTVSRESYSEESEGVPKIIRESAHGSPRRKVKKAESMNVESGGENKGKSIFSSMQLKKIEQKNDEYRNDSQINDSSQIAEQISGIEEEINLLPQPAVEWNKPKLTLDSLSKPWSGNQNIIETESIVGDDDQESLYNDCSLQLVRADHLRQYSLECGNQDTFHNAVQVLARLERVRETDIKLLFNFDQVSRSGISNKSSKGIANTNSPLVVRSLKKHRSSLDVRGHFLGPQKEEGLKTLIVEWASRMKNRILKIQFEVTRE